MTEPTRILFVDDEPRVLEALRDRLRRRRSEWDMQFAAGGPAALRLLASQSFDVVVTELRMADVDGFGVLAALRERHPGTVRIVLSGDLERETAVRLVPNAHRVLVKPCKLNELEIALESACRLSDLIADESVRELLGKIAELPPMPKTYARLVRALEDDTTSFSDIGNVLASDIALSTKVLKIANSAAFGGGRSIASVDQAIGVLGTDLLRTIVLSDGVMGPRELPGYVRGFATELNAHSSLVARVAAELTAAAAARREAFSAGMLHDVGRLVMALEMPLNDNDMATRVLRLPSAHAPTTSPDHARVGAYLLGLWGVPGPVIEAVAKHHDPVDEAWGHAARVVVEAEEIVHALSKGLAPTEAAVEKMLVQARELRVGREARMTA